MSAESQNVVDCANPLDFVQGIARAKAALARNGLVVLPTDTVYGIAADAFSPEGVVALLAAKGRTRQSPPPVLVANTGTLEALAEIIPAEGRTLIEHFWPGALTLVFAARESLSWDLGDTHGTVALRQPADDIALAILSETGPLAVSSANLTAQAPALSVAEAGEQLGDSVAVYFDGGNRSESTPSTILDLSRVQSEADPIPVLRLGRLSIAALAEASGIAAERFQMAEGNPRPQ